MFKKVFAGGVVIAIIGFLILAQVRSTRADTTWSQIPIEGINTGKQQTSTQVFDIDKDGIDDFAMTERTTAPSAVWYKKVGSSWQKYIIDATPVRIEAGGDHYDIDGDGDLDIAHGGDYQSNEAWWWENPYPNFTPDVPWVRHTIKASGGTQHHDSMFGNFYGDASSTQFVIWNQGASQLLIATIPPDPRTAGLWTFTIVDTVNGAEGLTKADIDGDGIVDIIGGGSWYKYLGNGQFSRQVIDATQKFTRAAAGQFIPGGFPEVIFVPGDLDGPLNFYQWNGSAWEKKALLNGITVIHGHSLRTADINNDGTLDIFLGEMGLTTASPKMRLLYGNGAGDFQEQILSTTVDNHESRLGDFDGDGDLDILQKPYTTQAPGATLWINTTALSLDKWERQVVDSSKPWRAIFITSGDLDGDGLKDIITGGWWYKNPGNPSGAWTRRTIGAPLYNMAAVFDFDHDGDLDILGTQGQGANINNQFAWGRNDGSGNFTILTNVSTGGTGDFLQGVAVDRFSDTGYKVALSWHNGGGGVQMLTIPADPSTSTWNWENISSTTQDEQISSGDIDRDGDVDLLLGTQWLRNNSDGTWSPFILNTAAGSPDRNRLGDINKDGRLDSIVGYEAISVPGKLAWYEQPLVATDPWVEHIISTAVVGPMSLDVADIDKDGSQDVVVGEHNLTNPTTAKLFVFKNLDGVGGTWNPYTVSTGDENHDGAQLTDIDNDGDLDIMSIGWGHSNVLLFKNMNWLGTSSAETEPPTAPTNLTATAVSSNQINLNWTASTDNVGVTGYKIFRNGALITSITSTTTYQSTGLVSSTLYTFQVQALDASGNVSATSSPASATTASAPAGTFVAYWPLNETVGTTASDSSGLGNTGTLINSPVWGAGKVGGGLLFDGTTKYVNIPNSSSLSPTSNKITLEAWVYANTVTGTPQMIVSKPVSATTHVSPYFSYGLSILAGGKVQFAIASGPSTLIRAYGASNLAPNTWYHLAGVYSGTNMTVYINGVAGTPVANTANLRTYTTPVRIGVNGGLGEPMNGTIDDVRIYSRALSQAEVVNDMNGVTADTTTPTVSITAPADGASIDEGTSVTLSANASDNIGVTAVDFTVDGNIISTDTTSPFTATWSGFTAGTHSLTAIAHDSAGNNTISGTVSVTVAPAPTPTPVPPTLTLAANPTSLSAGQSSTLTWNSTDTDSCTASDAWSGAKAISGTSVVAPNDTSTFTLDCTGPAGSATKSVTITVQPIPSSLIALWSLNETLGTTASDSSGLGNTGTLINSPVWGAGKVGGGLLFDGTTKYVNIPNSSSLSPTSNKITLEAWVYANTVTGTPQMIVSKPVSATTHVSPYFSYGLSILAGGKVQFAIASGPSTLIRAYGASNLAPNTWYHLAGVYSGTNMTVYINGVAGTPVANTANLRTYTTPVRIGVNGGLGEPMNGTIDDVRIYSRALSQAEVVNDMNGSVAP
jgi:chitodextrinase